MSKFELQQRVADFVVEHQLSADAVTRMLDLQSELGELAKELLKASDYGRKPFASTPDWELELGDVFFALLALAEVSGVDLEGALELALDKYWRRLSESGQAESGR